MHKSSATSIVLRLRKFCLGKFRHHQTPPNATRYALPPLPQKPMHQRYRAGAAASIKY
jgi:hypothetical protein